MNQGVGGNPGVQTRSGKRGKTGGSEQHRNSDIQKGNEEVKLTSDVHNRPPY